ncbi:hypothetical protein KL925_004645 [Ogataea polymorpha]|nr:hypothetical protein KL936_004454 [Ogataea polymorpha]KAG7898287.1 hypothetical protein KL935_004437 [Ogataea polymorpha]KAG7906383.1 hypothetical protein KL906_004475 [Ogataea polymorpha]KAG7914414.1 hypothetical protein KL927_004608 [Ogataea polymorpha]KAG7925168.1 hypothetical protein KL925_004645 [Ogataea polymorpha]
MLSGQHAFITGGSQGLGYAIARKLGSHGCQLTLLSRNLEILQRRAQELNETYPHAKNHDYVAYDLRNPSGLESMVKSHERLKTANILVNCAGISQSSLLMSTPSQEIQDIINVNLTSPLILSKLFVRNMLRLQNPNIVNISSVLARDCARGTTAYSVSKSGLNKLTQTLAFEMKSKKVRVNAIMPGLMPETDIGKKVTTGAVKLSRLSCDDVAEKVLLLIVDPEMTGECVAVE